jgi:ATP-dependent helicase HrpB
VTTDGVITATGRQLQALGVHPRLGVVLLAARAAGTSATGAALAALLGERDLLRGPEAREDADIRTRLDRLRRADPATAALRRTAVDLLRRLGEPAGADALGAIDSEAAGPLLAAGWPDRVARAREEGGGRFVLASGRGAVLTAAQSLGRAAFLVAPAVAFAERDARIQLAAPLSLADIRRACPSALRRETRVAWDPRLAAVVAETREVLDALTLASEPLRDPDPEQVRDALLAGIRELGLEALPWDAGLRQWQARVALVAQYDPSPPTRWPDVHDTALLATLGDWLAPWLDGLSRRDHLRRLDLGTALRAQLPPPLPRRLDELAPTHWPVPSGSRIAID